MAIDVNEKLVTEAEKQDNLRWEELSNKQENELNEEEKKEKQELKDRYGKRMQSRIDKLTWETKTAQEELERERQERERLRIENENLRKTSSKPVTPAEDDYTEIEGKKWLTDATLLRQVKSGEITEDDAYKYQRRRDRAETVVQVKEDLKKEREFEQENMIRLGDAQKVLKEYPHFAKISSDGSPNPSFNPEDPLYKMTNEIYLDGYNRVPDGLSKSLKRAKQILGVNNPSIERSGELGLDISSPPSINSFGLPKEITLNEAEKESAIRMYTRGDAINPKTRRPYTSNEALVAGLEAKKTRLQK